MNNKTLTLTIVIPVYNEQGYLKACLDSIASQTVKPLEVILVDNNSTDKSVQIARKYPFVKVISEKNQGIGFARNSGFNAAKGDIIGRIDADTKLALDWIDQVLKYFAAHPAASAVTGDCYFYDFPMRRSFHSLHKFIYYRLQKWIAGTEILWGSNMAIQREAWVKVRSICSDNTNIHEDIDLSLRLKSKHLKIFHHDKLRAEVSLRRGDLGIGNLVVYLSAWHRTYILNGQNIRSLFIYLLGLVTLIGAVLFLPFRALAKNREGNY